MDNYDSEMKKAIQDLYKTFEPIRKNLETISEMMSTVQIPTFKIPDFNIPKFDLPTIDYERIQSAIETNSNYGWTLPPHMDIGYYISCIDYCSDKDETDKYFMSYYESSENIDELKDSIIGVVNEKWDDTLEDIFDLATRKKHIQLIIPTLITIIEGEVAELAHKKDLVGKSLLSHVESKFSKEEDVKFTAYVISSLFHYMRESLFGRANFEGVENTPLNRNLVLHGRDNPANWKQEDAFRLLSVLSTIILVKEILLEE